VVATSHTDIADRAGVGAATVYRHFPTLGSLVEACSAKVHEIVRPPDPSEAPDIFAGLGTRRERLERLVAELDSLYRRAAPTMVVAQRDRDRIPELDASLRRLEASVEALVRAAVDNDAPEPAVRLAIALAFPPVWQSMQRQRLPAAAMVRLLSCALSEEG
jgi:AcrR family transcriptional regulator